MEATKKLYDKEAISFQQQVDLLKSRGLTIESEILAISDLKSIGYYRLSGYMFPFLADKKGHIYKEGSSFDKVLMLYSFDRELRLLILDAIERIEIAFRTQLVYHLSIDFGPWWFERSDLFKNQEEYAGQIQKIKDSVAESEELFITHFKDNYTNDHPPAWMALEIITFRQLSVWYQNLVVKETKRKISSHFSSNYVELGSWIHAMVYIRNLCAHHCRLWNRSFKISARFPQEDNGRFISQNGVTNQRLYFSLSILLYLLNEVNPDSPFKDSLLALLNRYPEVDKQAMGFPGDWATQPVWQANA